MLYVGGGNFGKIVLWRVPLNGTKLVRLSKAALLPQVLDAPGANPVEGTKNMHLSTDGKSILATEGVKEIYVFNLANRKARRLTGIDGNCLMVLPNGQVVTSLFAAGKSTVKVYSAAYQASCSMPASQPAPFSQRRPLAALPKSVPLPNWPALRARTGSRLPAASNSPRNLPNWATTPSPMPCWKPSNASSAPQK